MAGTRPKFKAFLTDESGKRILELCDALAGSDGGPVLRLETLELFACEVGGHAEGMLVEIEAIGLRRFGGQFDDRLVDFGEGLGRQGELTAIGELLAAIGPGMPELYVEPFATMFGDFFAYGGYLGMLFDPYRGHGVHPEVEVVTHRVAGATTM